MRHLDIRQLYIQHLVASGRVKISKIPGTENTADIGTKAVTAAVFFKLLGLLGVFEEGSPGDFSAVESKKPMKIAAISGSSASLAGVLALLATLV